MPNIPEGQPILIHKASSLKASVNTIRLATIQPFGKLICNDDLGPHYSEDKCEEAHQKALSFIKLAKENKAEITIAPEYFTPLKTIQEIINDPNILHINTIFILPLESLRLDDYESLYHSIEEKGFDSKRTRLEPYGSRTFVNCCAIIFRDEEKISFLLQSKISPSRWERQNLIPSTEFFIIEGENIALLVLLCSDAHDMRFHNLWAQAAAHKSGALIIHSQWNRQPDFPNYKGFWANILDKEDGEKRIIVSMNWAANSEILDEQQNQLSIERSRTRFFRGKVLQNTPLFIERSKSGLHVHNENRGHRKIWEVWHALVPTEHAYIIDMCRPFENVTESEESHDYGVRHSTYFEFNSDTGNFDNCWPRSLSTPFWKICEDFGLSTEAHSELNDMTICHLELLCNGCLMNEYGTWMTKDVICRIPTAPISCASANCQGCSYNQQLCSEERPKWEGQIQHFIQCLQSFHTSEPNNNNVFKIMPTSSYPLNVVDSQNNEKGWLFHGKGYPVRFLEKKIGEILKKRRLVTFRGSLHLFIVGCDEEIVAEKIFYQPYDVTRPPTKLMQKRQENPEHYPDLKITKLHS